MEDEARTLSLSTTHRPSLKIIIIQTSSTMTIFLTPSFDGCILAHSQDTNLLLPRYLAQNHSTNNFFIRYQSPPNQWDGLGTCRTEAPPLGLSLIAILIELE
jgi:hypothetical protein